MTIQAKTEAPTIFVSGKTPVDHLVAQVKEIADRRLSSGRDAQVGLRWTASKPTWPPSCARCKSS
jgi:hypothetical protein